MDAMSRVREIVNNANGRGQAYSLYVGMVTVDVKNAFNSAPWQYVLNALRSKKVPEYLHSIISAYLRKRRINFSLPDGETCSTDIWRGVPQGSILELDLWNVLYDGLLSITLPRDVEFIAFADDITLFSTAQVPYLLEERLEEALSSTVDWLTDHGLDVAIEKTEAIVLTRRNVRNTMQLRFQGHTINSQSSLSYLGMQLNSRCDFREHAELVTKRAAETCRRLQSLLPNAKGPRQMKRRLLAWVVLSRLLYGAPFWFRTIVKGAMEKLSRVARKIMLRVATCYHNVSYAGAAVVLSILPLKLLTRERSEVHCGIDRAMARDDLLLKWQDDWQRTKTGRWTYTLIGNLKAWYGRKNGEVNFHITQVLTGHGYFRAYLHRFGISDTDACALCSVAPDYAEHAIFACDLAYRWRTEACVYLGISQLTPENMVNVMLSSASAWKRISDLISKIMLVREKEERTRQRAAQ